MSVSIQRSLNCRSFVVVHLILTLVLLIGTTGAGAQEMPELAIEHYTLDNGLQVILHEDHTIPTVTVNIWYHVGSKNERPGHTGFAHLFEHMMFEGSEHHDDLFQKPLHKVGGRNNGGTHPDSTTYWETVPSDQLELALWLESDRMGFLLPAMTPERLENQKNVVGNEIRQALNVPYSQADLAMLDLLYHDEHPYSWPVAGTLEDVAAASLDDTREFFETYYIPNNASLCIAGDIDPVRAKTLVKRYFGSIPPGPAVTRLEQWVPELDGVRRTVVEDAVELPRLYIAWHTPGLFEPGDATGRLLATVLGTGKTSRLYQHLVYELQIAQEVAVGLSENEVSNYLVIVATARPGHTLAELEQAIDAELVRLQERGVTETELHVAQAEVETEQVRALQRTGGFGGTADLLNRYMTFVGDPGYLADDLQAYRQATTTDLQRFARRYLPLDRRVIVHVVPQGDLAAADESPDRSRMPESSGPVAFHPPRIQRTTLSNGLELYLVERHELPLVEVDLVVFSGWSADPTGTPGAAALTAELLDEGSASRNALQISEDVRRLGATLSTWSFFDGTQIRLNLLRSHLDEGLELVSDILLHPTFPSEELERQRTSCLARIRQEADSPQASAVKTLQRLIFGSAHPYAQPYTGSGTAASIQALTRDDLVTFYRAHYLPNNAAVVVVGDLGLAEARARLERVLGGWQPGDVSRPPVPQVEPDRRGRLFLIDRPGAPQSMIVAGEPSLARNHPDRLAFSAMNNGLGGQLVSRLNMNLREDKGYTYGIRSVWAPFREAGLFFVATAVQTRYTKESMIEILKEINDIKEGRPFTSDELKEIVDGLELSFPQRFQTYDGIARQLGTLVLHDEPLDDWQTYAERIAAVDAATVSRVVAEHLKPEQLTFVIVGDVAKIKDGLQELGLGEITVLDPEELLQ